MKITLLICVLYAISEGSSLQRARNCIVTLDGVCITECPNGTHEYASACDYLIREQTCSTLFPQKELNGKLCNYNACYCDVPTVKYDNKCIPLEDCPKVTECPEGTYLYSVENDYISPEPNCSDPNPDKDETYGVVANYTACYCSSPNVRTIKGKCVKVDQCGNESK